VLLCGGGRGGSFALLDGRVSAEGGEEVGEEGALGWHSGVVHEDDARRIDVRREKIDSRERERRRNKEFAESSDCGVDTAAGGVYSVRSAL